MCSLGMVTDPLPGVLLLAIREFDFRVHVPKVKKLTSNPNSDWIGCLKAKEPNARFAIAGHVRANVQFGKAGHERDVG